ncbi:flagellar protein FlgN [Bacteriovoracaceae bacterium]|nr:flagellar protein FlgN [Bacteriovoracaceae bacterium]
MSDLEQTTNLKFLFHNLTNIWEDFCRCHHLLYDFTCQEHINLMESDIDGLEKTALEKDKVLLDIEQLDTLRKECVNDISHIINPNNPATKISELIELVEGRVDEKELDTLKKLNLLLIDIIQKLQEQNKRNQIFLNRSIISLNELKEEFTGKKYSTYGPSGNTNASTK